MLYYSAVPLAVKTVFKKIHLGKCANYYEALSTGVLYFEENIIIEN